jgi:hypothetical protein
MIMLSAYSPSECACLSLICFLIGFWFLKGFVLNLIFDSDATRILGLENHVCELQLVLRSFAANVWAKNIPIRMSFRLFRTLI